MKLTFAFLVMNYLLLIIGRLYQFDDSTFLWTHYSTMLPLMKWNTEFGHLNRGDMLTSEQHRCTNE
ncbi:hypothetical protein, partial [Lonsdalea populi]